MLSLRTMIKIPYPINLQLCGIRPVYFNNLYDGDQIVVSL